MFLFLFRGARGMPNCQGGNVLHQEKNIQNNEKYSAQWFAMSATFGRALKAKEYLEGKSVRCFVPMKYEIVCRKNLPPTRKLIPAIKNLIFVYTSQEILQKLKSQVPYLQYLTQAQNGKNVPITVPQKQMQPFIELCQTHHEKLTYIALDEIDLKKGEPVRFVGGGLDGLEGTFVKVNKSRKKRVVVQVQGVAVVIKSELWDGYLQVLEQEKNQKNKITQ